MRVTRLKLLKKMSLAVLMGVAMLFFFYGVASANWGPHGGYGNFRTTVVDPNAQQTDPTVFNPDTDACAGCHRAHTAVSEITWTDTALDTKSALLIGTTGWLLVDFCYTCHGDAAAGAATNVQSGVYETGVPSTPGYATNQSETTEVLNGGGFDDIGDITATMTSIHIVDGGGALAWGGGNEGLPNDGPGTYISGMDCASCHDPHGSSNYRILKDTVNGVAVGGYVSFASVVDPNPTPFVVSNEVGYPKGDATHQAGFRLHRNYGDLDNDGVTEDGDYRPDYTEARYARPRIANGGGSVPAEDPLKGMSAWCAACHTLYNTQSSLGQAEYNADGYDPAIGYGDVIRHRHPVNVALNTFYGDRALIVGQDNGRNEPWDPVNGTAMVYSDPPGATGDDIDVPLEHDPFTESQGASQVNDITDAGGRTSDYMGCLACHRAHGTNARMAGYANSDSNTFPAVDNDALLNGQGVPPANDSVLLRASNRGVCERCHNK